MSLLWLHIHRSPFLNLYTFIVPCHAVSRGVTRCHAVSRGVTVNALQLQATCVMKTMVFELNLCCDSMYKCL